MKCTTKRSLNFLSATAKTKRRHAGHTFIETIVAMWLLGLMIVSLYAGFSSGLAVLQLSRENQRATQILEERMEVIRLIKWDDVAPGFIPTAFTAPFYAGDTTHAGAMAYTGTVTVAKADIPESYAQHMRMIQIDLTWSSANVTRTRQMTTLVSRYGIQNYVY